MKYSLELVVNPVSFGQVSIGVLREIYKRDQDKTVPLFVIKNNFSLDCFDEEPEFAKWLKTCIDSALKDHRKADPVFKLWHLEGSMKSYSRDQTLFTFHELDAITPEELNIINAQKKVIVSSQFTKETFETYGAKNVEYVPLGFETQYFFNTNKKYLEDRITFGVVGKFENRKGHVQMIRAWLKKYGNNPKYFLDCAIYNSFAKHEENQSVWAQILEGKNYTNINFHPFMTKNVLYNDYLNSLDIGLFASGGEAWGLPEFHTVGLGKHAVVLNAHGYKGWATKQNSVLFDPNGKKECYDGAFFHKGRPFNQGNLFTFSDDDFINACEEAVKRHENNPINEEGKKLQEKFSCKRMTDSILKIIES